MHMYCIILEHTNYFGLSKYSNTENRVRFEPQPVVAILNFCAINFLQIFAVVFAPWLYLESMP